VQKHACPIFFRSGSVRGLAGVALAAGVGVLAFAVGPAEADQCPSVKSAFNAKAASLIHLDSGPDRVLDILAIGSSSTEGVGASAPSRTYPAQLAEDLTREDGIAAQVKNAGIGGELAAKTLQRLTTALKSSKPELVIWQVGTNDAIVGVDEALFRATVESGIAAVRAAGVPLVLVGPQFSLKIPDTARYQRFVAMVDEIGERLRVPVLSRYAMMKQAGAETLALLSRDGLHMSDLGYRCLARALAEEIEDASRPGVGAKL
jgi:acyl-CoA thioesterase-1